MKKNMGAVDRVVRTVIALVIVALLFKGVISGVLGIVLGVLAVVFLATSAIGSCPLYVPLKISTGKPTGSAGK